MWRHGPCCHCVDTWSGVGRQCKPERAVVTRSCPTSVRVTQSPRLTFIFVDQCLLQQCHASTWWSPAHLSDSYSPENTPTDTSKLVWIWCFRISAFISQGQPSDLRSSLKSFEEDHGIKVETSDPNKFAGVCECFSLRSLPPRCFSNLLHSVRICMSRATFFFNLFQAAFPSVTFICAGKSISTTSPLSSANTFLICPSVVLYLFFLFLKIPPTRVQASLLENRSFPQRSSRLLSILIWKPSPALSCDDKKSSNSQCIFILLGFSYNKTGEIEMCQSKWMIFFTCKIYKMCVCHEVCVLATPDRIRCSNRNDVVFEKT